MHAKLYMPKKQDILFIFQSRSLQFVQVNLRPFLWGIFALYIIITGITFIVSGGCSQLLYC